MLTLVRKNTFGTIGNNMKTKITFKQLKRLVSESMDPIEKNLKRVDIAIKKFNALRKQALDKIGDEDSLYYETGSTLQSGPQYVSEMQMEMDGETVTVTWVEEEMMGWKTRRVAQENRAKADDEFEIDNLVESIQYMARGVKKALKYYEKLNPDNEEEVLADLEQDDVDESVEESEIKEAAIRVPDFDPEDALEVLAKIFNRAKFLGLEPCAYHSTPRWNGWRFMDTVTTPAYRSRLLRQQLFADMGKWITEKHLTGVIRVGTDGNGNYSDWMVWPAKQLPQGNRIRSIARKYAGNDARITKPFKLPYTGLKLDGKTVVDYIGSDEHVVIPKGVTELAAAVFANNKSLKTIELPKTLNAIGQYTFSGSSLESIVMPDSVQWLGRGAFSGCTNLKSVKLSKNMMGYVENDIFEGCTSLASLTIPDKLDPHRVDVPHLAGAVYNESKTILFSVPKMVETFDIPPTVQLIQEYAFDECYKLASITIPDSVKKIGRGAFRRCSALTSIALPDNVTLEREAFYHCENLQSITLPKGMTTLPYMLFEGCYKLASIDLPAGLTTIDSAAFAYCHSLNNLVIPKGVSSIGASAFETCSSLESIVIPEGVTKLESVTFSDCEKLASVTLPETLVELGSYAFSSCPALASIRIPESVTQIGNEAFRNCSSLSKVKLPSGLFETIIKDPDKSFKGTPWAEKVKNGGLSFDVDDRGTLDKYDGHDTVVTIPEEVHVIGAGAFFGNNTIRKVTIPDTVTVIEPGAFENCEELETIVLGVGIKKIEKDTFKNVSKNITIYVPDFDMCKLLLDSGLPDSATVIIGKGSSRRRLSWDPER